MPIDPRAIKDEHIGTRLRDGQVPRKDQTDNDTTPADATPQATDESAD